MAAGDLFNGVAMNILKDKRLMLCAEMVKGDAAADIGTDHGYLPTHLVLQGKCTRCIAADINPMPLDAARKTVTENGVSTKVDIVLSDGLESVELTGITDIIIAGMGGELIARIIDDCKTLHSKDNDINLILQPMTRPEELRIYLYENGFEVTSERCVREGRFIYSVMCARFIGEKPAYEMDERYIHLGRTDITEGFGKEYALDRINKLKKAAEGMLKSKDSRQEGLQKAELVKMLTDQLREAEQ